MNKQGFWWGLLVLVFASFISVNWLGTNLCNVWFKENAAGSFLFSSIQVINSMLSCILPPSFSSLCFSTLSWCVSVEQQVFQHLQGFSSDLSLWTGVLSWGTCRARASRMPTLARTGDVEIVVKWTEKGPLCARSMDHRETASVQGDQLKIWIDLAQRVRFRQSSPECTG